MSFSYLYLAECGEPLGMLSYATRAAEAAL